MSKKQSARLRRGPARRKSRRDPDVIVKRAFVEALVRSGDLDPTGCSDEELLLAAQDLVTEETLVMFSLDRTPDLLRRARQAARDGTPEFAAVFYATWFEHWLNSIVQTACERAGLTEEATKETVRTSWRFRLWCLPSLVGWPPIPKSVGPTIQRVMDLRNEFLHYKWPARPGPEDHAVSLPIDVEAVIARLRRYQRTWVMKGLKRRRFEAYVRRDRA